MYINLCFLNFFDIESNIYQVVRFFYFYFFHVPEKELLLQQAHLFSKYASFGPLDSEVQGGGAHKSV